MQTYFLANVTDNLIKVGRTECLARRMKQLAQGNPNIVLVGYLEGDREQHLHDLFAHDRIPGTEWFTCTSGRLCKWLDRMRSLGRLQGPYSDADL